MLLCLRLKVIWSYLFLMHIILYDRPMQDRIKALRFLHFHKPVISVDNTILRCLIKTLIPKYENNVWSIKIRATHNLSLWLYEYFWIILLNGHLVVYFKGLGMRNLQYEMRVWQKSHNKVTKTVYLWFEILWIRRYLYKLNISFHDAAFNKWEIRFKLISANIALKSCFC